MQRNRRFATLIPLLALAGCHQSSPLVYVDLDAVQAQSKQSVPSKILIPSPPETRPGFSETVPGEPAVSIPDPSSASTRNVQEMFRAEQAAALAELQRRLRQFYHGEAAAFSLLETKSIAIQEQGAYAAANNRIRTIFDDWAVKRAPVFAKLAMVAGFPIPPATQSNVAKSPNPEMMRKRDEAEKLRIQLKAIDAQFYAQSDEILAGVTKKSAADQAELKEKIEAKAKELDKRAEDEANAQIRQAVSKLSFRLASPTPLNLPARPGFQLSIPAEKPLDPAPKVPSSGILEDAADRRRLLEHELRIWLALNRYTLASSPKGNRDFTQEFQKWRQLHGAGP